jgi:hypothetical protein
MITFLTSSSGEVNKFVILFGDIASVRIARLIHVVEHSDLSESDVRWMDIDPHRTTLSVDVMRNEMQDGFLFPINQILFYNSERAVRIFKLFDEYGLEFFEIEMDSDIFK